MLRPTLPRPLRASRLTATVLAIMAPAAFTPVAAAATSSTLLAKLVDRTNDGVLSDTKPVTLGAKTYFSADDGTHGSEPWVITPGGASMLADLTAGPESSYVRFIGAGNETYVLAGDPDGLDNRLFITDGTTAGTRPVPGIPENLTDVSSNGGNLYARTGNDELFRRTAPASAFERVSLPGLPAAPKVDGQFPLPDTLMLSVYDADSSSGSKHLVATTATGFHTVAFGDAPLALVYDNNHKVIQRGERLFFSGTVAGEIRQFSSDGTDSGTHLLTLPNGAPAAPQGDYIPSEPGHLLFRQNDTWFDTDGQATTDLGAAPPNLRGAIYAGGTVYYGAAENEFGASVIRTYSRALGSPNAPEQLLHPFAPIRFVSSGDGVYFTSRTDTPDAPTALFRTDGTVAGTQRVVDETAFPSGGSGALVADPAGGLLFAAGSASFGWELFRASGEPGEAPTLVVDANSHPTDSAIEPSLLSRGSFGGLTLFSDFAPIHDADRSWREPWVTDGTPDGTHRLVPETSIGASWSAAPYGDQAVFRAAGALWITDGTAEGTRRLTTADAGVGDFEIIGASIYYTATTAGPSSPGLFESDGTSAGELVRGPNGGASIGSVGDLKAVGSDLYFSAPPGLWKRDGTTGALTQLMTGSPRVAEGVVAGGVLYFPVGAGERTQQIWVSDGTQAGTQNLDIAPDVDPFEDGLFGAALSTNGAAVMVHVPYGGELPPDWEGPWAGKGLRIWRIVGTTVDEPAVPDGVVPKRIGAAVPLGDAFYAASGSSLLRIGVTGPATIVRSFRDDIGDPAVVSGKLYFRASDAEHGAELWSSDGTTAGTALASDVLAGPEGSQPDTPFAAGTKVAFMASTPETGRQLFALDEPTPDPTPPPTPAPLPTPTPSASPTPPTPSASPTPTPSAKPAPTPSADPTQTATGTGTASPKPRAMPDRVKTRAGAVRATGKSYVFVIAGSVVAAEGLRTRRECSGRVDIVFTTTTKKGKGTKAETTTKRPPAVRAKLTWTNGTCTFQKTVTIAKSDVPSRAKLQATVTYRGSATQHPKTGEPTEIRLG